MANPFSAFLMSPMMSFEGQEDGERVVLLLRAHLVTLVPALLLIIFLVFVPFLVPSILSLLAVDLAGVLTSGQTFLIGLFWYLLVFAYAFYRFIFWYFNIYLVTNERIVDFDFRGLLHKETSYANLSQIQDITPKTIGFFGTLFHYGDIFLQTAGTKREFEFHHVPRLNEAVSKILEERRKEEAEAPGEVA